jgi:hypothetical protein
LSRSLLLAFSSRIAGCGRECKQLDCGRSRQQWWQGQSSRILSYLHDCKLDSELVLFNRQLLEANEDCESSTGVDSQTLIILDQETPRVRCTPPLFLDHLSGWLLFYHSHNSLIQLVWSGRSTGSITSHEYNGTGRLFSGSQACANRRIACRYIVTRVRNSRRLPSAVA